MTLHCKQTHGLTRFQGSRMVGLEWWGLVTFAVDFARGLGGPVVFTGRWSAVMSAMGAASVLPTGCVGEFGADLTQGSQWTL